MRQFSEPFSNINCDVILAAGWLSKFQLLLRKWPAILQMVNRWRDWLTDWRRSTRFPESHGTYYCLQDPGHLKDTLVGEEDARLPLMAGARAHLLPQTLVRLPLHWINLPYLRASISTSKSKKNVGMSMQYSSFGQMHFFFQWKDKAVISNVCYGRGLVMHVYVRVANFTTNLDRYRSPNLYILSWTNGFDCIGHKNYGHKIPPAYAIMFPAKSPCVFYVCLGPLNAGICARSTLVSLTVQKLVWRLTKTSKKATWLLSWRIMLTRMVLEETFWQVSCYEQDHAPF